MFENISFITYGRCIKNKSWYLDNIPGVNRVYFIHSGSVLYENDRESHILSPGNVYIFPQNLAFRLVTDENTNIDHTFFDFFTSPAIVMESFLKLTPSEDSLLNAALMPLLKIAREHSMGNDCKNGIYFSLTKSYLKNFLEIVNVTHPLSILGDEIIIGAASFIHNNFKQNISVTYLADKYCLEKNAFIRKFKKHLGITPYQYIKNLRLNYAASLIKEHRYPLSEIAEKSGYSDAASLSHAIKKTYGDYPKNLK